MILPPLEFPALCLPISLPLSLPLLELEPWTLVFQRSITTSSKTSKPY
jgi:hypothetical protein